MSSVLMSRPSISKRQALTGGKLGGCVRNGTLRGKKGADSVFGTMMAVSLKLVEFFEIVDLSTRVFENSL